jgi:hypothetical protein
MWDWLSWSGWNGVAAIATLFGSVAIVIAVAEFLIQRNGEPPDATSFHVERSTPQDGVITVTVKMRVLGSVVLYEPRWELYDDGRSLPDLPPRLDATDGWQSVVLRFWEDIPLEKIKLGVVWIVPKKRAYAAGARAPLRGSGHHQRWVLYRWRLWPRKAAGRWVSATERTSSRFRLAPPPNHS